MNIVEHVSLLQVGIFSGFMPRRGIAGSSGSTMSNFLRNLQTYFQNGSTSLQSHQQRRSVPLSPHPHQNLLSPELLILAILIGVRWMWRKRNTPPLLVGLQAGTITLEISLAVPQKIGHSTTGRSSYTSPEHIPRYSNW